MPQSTEQGEQLHRRLVDGDPVASSEIVLAYLEPTIRRLRTRFPEVRDEAILCDAATDAIFGYIRDPNCFDPTKSNLSGYLAMAARGDLLNALAKERRRASRQVPLDLVEEGSLGGNIESESTARIEDGMAANDLIQLALREVSDPMDRRLLSLMLDGERRTAAYAEVLRISSNSFDEQRREVKRHKDRLTKRLERLGVRLREEKNR